MGGGGGLLWMRVPQAYFGIIGMFKCKVEENPAE